MDFSFRDTALSPWRPQGRQPTYEELSESEARRRAEKFLRHPPSDHVMSTWKLLCTAGVLTYGQIQELLGVSDRLLRKYTSKDYQLFHRLPPMHEHLRGLGFKDETKHLRLYCLGKVGLKMAELSKVRVPDYYLGAAQDNITHDVLCNEVIRYLIRAARALGWTWDWRSRYRGAVRLEAGPDKKVVHVEPDAVLRFTEPKGAYHVCVLEYHNEDTRRRALEKFEKYEELHHLGTSTFYKVPSQVFEPWWYVRTPILLVASTHMAPLNGFKHAIDTRQGAAHPMNTVDGRWYGHLWKTFETGKSDPLNALRWIELQTMKASVILPA
jgi:hypothetical protein